MLTDFNHAVKNWPLCFFKYNVGKNDISVSIDPMDPRPSRRLNLARLIMIYVRKFELTCPNEALQYFFLLRTYNNEDDLNLFKVCVCDLVIETKEYNRILGTVEPNGIRTKGLTDQFVTAEITTESIAEMVAETLVKKGLFQEAIEVYDIANASLFFVLNLKTYNSNFRTRKKC